jgi:UDP-N-acetyl-D-mannosaminuronate dehydrogenase
LKTKDVIAGLGEIGNPILKLVSKATIAIGYDINPKLVDDAGLKKYRDLQTRFLHICIPYNERFTTNVKSLFEQFEPKSIVIHSTISPYTTKNLQEKLPIPIIYSATRGVHKRMLYDLKRYTKFYAVESNTAGAKVMSKEYSKLMRKCGVRTQKMTNPVTLELAKIICDTSYLGWLINYAQISNMIAIQHGVNYDEMWLFSDEIHKLLGNRPKMFPGYIGGHCVIPNLDLMHNQTLNLIKQMNDMYAKKVKNAKTIAKRYGAKMIRK